MQDIFSDPIIEFGATNTSLLEDKNFFPNAPPLTVTVGFKPGVTDNPGAAANDGFKILFPDGQSSISTYISYAFLELSEEIDHDWLASTLFNGLIQKSILTTKDQLETGQATKLTYPDRPEIERQAPAIIDLEVDDEQLVKLAGIVQKLVTAQSKGAEGEFGLSEKEKEQLLANIATDVAEIQVEADKITETISE